MVKPGYKQTEIGVLPEDWDVVALLDKAYLLNGLTYTPDNIREYGLLVMRSSNVQNGKFAFDDNVYVNCEVEDNKFIKKGDILICVRNGSSALIGKCAKADRDYDATFGAFMAVLRGENNDYIFQLLQQGAIQKHIAKNSDSTINQITNGDFKQIFVPFPKSEAERVIISEVLSDIDTLIVNLEKLIVKKKAIKQGAMQELLTGKRRLPGFDEEWMDSSIGDICELVSGGTPSTSVAEYWDGDIPWCTPTDITSCNGKYLYKTADSITILGLANSSATMLPEGALLLCTRATIGAVKITAIPICTNQGFKSLVVRDCADNEWLYYAIQMLKKEMVGQAIGSTFLEISRKALANIHIKLPSKEEQKAIAGILSDMDSEICELEQKYRKYCLIKQGMMSELLTGRIRLIDKEDA